MTYITQEIIKIILLGILVALFIAVNALFLVWMERKVSARIQLRQGPLHVGPQGLLQTLADAVKLLSKELVLPQEANKFLYLLAPIMTFAPVLSAFIVIPLGEHAVRFEAADWHATGRTAHPADATHAVAFEFVDYRRTD